MHIASPCRAMRGMTLIEILVVLVIIGILAMLAPQSVGILGEDRQNEDEMRRLTDAIALLQEQAQLEGRDYGILLETARYEFQRFDAFEQRWKPVEGDPVLSARELPPDLAFELTLEGRPVLLRRSELHDGISSWSLVPSGRWSVGRDATMEICGLSICSSRHGPAPRSREAAAPAGSVSAR